tara:strand:+ start:137 stop:292 length:156 start_codon:yes stop_codon:yes gene_type:complete
MKKIFIIFISSLISFSAFAAPLKKPLDKLLNSFKGRVFKKPFLKFFEENLL